MRAWITWGFAFLLVGGSCVAAWGSEWGPGEVVPIDLPLLLDGVEDPLPTIVRGEVVLPGDCDYCYLHLVQYRFVVPAGAVRLVLELRNETNPTDDLDMILRLGQPITEDEDAYYFTYRTYEEGGSDRLEVGDEDDSDPLVPGEYYLGLVSLAGSGDRFEIRGACYVEEVLPEEVALQPNVPVRGTLPAQGLFPGIEAQFYLFVHEGAEVLAISAVAPGGEVDLHVGRRPVSRSASGRIEADLSLRASGEDEVLFLSSPALGRHWIVLENPTGLPQSFSLTATTVPVILPIESGGTITGRIDPDEGLLPWLDDLVATSAGTLGLVQHRIDVPAGATGLAITLRALDGARIGLRIRQGQPVAVLDRIVEADLSSAFDEEHEVVLQGGLLRPGRPHFIAVEAVSGQVRRYELRVEVIGAAGREKAAAGAVGRSRVPACPGASASPPARRLPGGDLAAD
jgi:hypothetical protein